MPSSDASAAAGRGKPALAARPARRFGHAFWADSRIQLAGVTALGIVLRCLFLDSKSFWMDEGFSAFMARAPFSDFLRYIRGGEINMVAYYGLLRLWAHFGTSESFIRSLSVAASAATVPLIYLIAKRLFSARAGLIAALLLAVHPAHIAYAQEARSYALAVFLLCLSTWLLLRCLDHGRRSDYAFYAATAVLAIYSHIIAALIPLAQWPAVMRRMRSRSWFRLTIAALGSVVALAPAIFIVWTKGGHSADWIPPLSWHMLGRVWRLLTLRKFGWCYGLAWLAAVWTSLRRRNPAAERWPLVLIVNWLAVPVLCLIAISLLKPVLIPRLMLLSVPAAVLLAGRGVESIRRPWNWLLLAGMVAASLASARSYYRRPKPDWRAVTGEIARDFQSGDALAVVPQYGRFTVDYYRQRDGLPVSRVPYAAAGGELTDKSKAERLWLIVYGGQGYNAPAQEAIRAARGRNDYCVARSSQFAYIELFLMTPCTGSGKAQQ